MVAADGRQNFCFIEKQRFVFCRDFSRGLRFASATGVGARTSATAVAFGISIHGFASIANGSGIRLIVADEHPILSDDLLMVSFRQHRSTFEQLHEMIVADSRLHRVGEDWTNPRDPTTIGVSPERIAV